MLGETSKERAYAEWLKKEEERKKNSATFTILPSKLRGASKQEKDEYKEDTKYATIYLNVPAKRLAIVKGKIEKIRNHILDAPKKKGEGNYYSSWVRKEMKKRNLKHKSPQKITQAMKDIAEKWNKMTPEEKNAEKEEWIKKGGEERRRRVKSAETAADTRRKRKAGILPPAEPKKKAVKKPAVKKESSKTGKK